MSNISRISAATACFVLRSEWKNEMYYLLQNTKNIPMLGSAIRAARISRSEVVIRWGLGSIADGVGGAAISLACSTQADYHFW